YPLPRATVIVAFFITDSPEQRDKGRRTPFEQTAREKNNSFHEKKFVNSKHRITFATPNFNGGFI
uniref:hypothetical protein n=1 Tax=Alistipes putredinis TaxID=28117 RepID=UPI003FD6DADA